jgi:hypothetical protein
MHRPSTKKRALAVAAALSMVLLLATPASANTVSLTITGGTFNGISLGGYTFPPPCSPKPDLLQATFNAGGTGSLSGGWSRMFQIGGNPPSNQWYQADFSILVGNLTWALSLSGPPVWTYSLASAGPNHLILRANIYRIPSCDKTDLACIVTMKMTFTGAVSTTTALPTATLVGVATLNAASVAPHMIVSGCSAPFLAWSGQPASIVNMTMV